MECPASLPASPAPFKRAPRWLPHAIHRVLSEESVAATASAISDSAPAPASVAVIVSSISTSGWNSSWEAVDGFVLRSGPGHPLATPNRNFGSSVRTSSVEVVMREVGVSEVAVAVKVVPAPIAERGLDGLFGPRHQVAVVPELSDDGVEVKVPDSIGTAASSPAFRKPRTIGI